MKLQLWATGKAHELYVRDGVEDFTKRINRYYPVEWRIFPPAKQSAGSAGNDIKKAEADVLLTALQQDDFLVLLDENGKSITSPQLAAFIETRANNSTRQLIFVIGGAYGAGELLKKRADFTWSLSPLVFPHQLVRLVLAEQLYRACTIIRNEKYHHQ